MNNYTGKIPLSRVVICLSFLVIAAIGYPLWLTSREFPLVPVFEGLGPFSAPFDMIFLVIMAGLLLAMTIYDSRKLIILFILLSGYMVLMDQNRLQPYNYMFICMLLALTISSEDRNIKANTLRIIIISVYFWSGLHKFNSDFLSRGYPVLLKDILPQDQGDLFWKYSPLLAPIVETLIPFGLMTRKFRRLSVMVAGAMHLMIILTLSPLGYGWNLVVIPWNISMILLVIILFWGKESYSPISLFHWRRSLTKAVITILVLVMPIFNLFGLWDHYLSWNLYSGKIKYGAIYIAEPLKSEIPDYILPYLKTDNLGGEYIETTYWALGTMNVVPYPEERIYRKITEHICSFSKEPCSANLVLY